MKLNLINQISNYVPFILIPFIGWGVRGYLLKKGDWIPLKKATLIIGLIAFFLTEMARSFYRPYIYQNKIFDYYIADTIGNSIGTVTAIFMVMTLVGKNSKKDFQIICILIAGLLTYEALNIFSTTPFDWRDAVATLIFGGLSIWLYSFLLTKNMKKENIKHIEQ